jgi:hypothetical protein
MPKRASTLALRVYKSPLVVSGELPLGADHVPSAFKNLPAAASPEAGAGTAPFAPPEPLSPVKLLIAMVRSADRSPPPVIGAVVLMFLDVGTFAARSVVRFVTWLSAMLGMSEETNARKVGADGLPDVGPAHTRFADCVASPRARVPDPVIGDPVTVNMPGAVRATLVTVPPELAPLIVK